MKPSLFPNTDQFNQGDAWISSCGLYRYLLRRVWHDAYPLLPVVMVNPSDADATVNDPTVRWLTAFAKRRRYGGLLIGNLNAFRSPHPSVMRKATDPVGPENDRYLRELLALGGDLLVAWGNDGTFGDRDKAFLRLAADARLVCLGVTKGGHPKHPMARGKHRIPVDFEPLPFPYHASKQGRDATCTHDRLDEDGQCRNCGADRRGGGA